MAYAKVAMSSSIGERIRSGREAKRLSAAEFARAVGTTPTHLWRIECGTKGMARQPGRALLIRIAEKLGVTTDYLLLGIGDPPTPAAPEDGSSTAAAS